VCKQHRAAGGFEVSDAPDMLKSPLCVDPAEWIGSHSCSTRLGRKEVLCASKCIHEEAGLTLK
jgi:hypothetical protein